MDEKRITNAMETLKKIRGLSVDFCMDMFRLSSDEAGKRDPIGALRHLDNAMEDIQRCIRKSDEAFMELANIIDKLEENED